MNKEKNKGEPGVSRPVQALVLRPGSGWTQTALPVVWDHKSGIRIHWSGPIVRLPDGSMPSLWADLKRVNCMIEINGGNRKRGIMAYALSLLSQNDNVTGG